MKNSEIREMSPQEREHKIADLKAELFNLRFQNAIHQLDNPLRIVDVRRTIARIMTISREEQLHAEKQPAAKAE